MSAENRLQIVLIRPGSTDFDEQQRIRGTLDIPLNQAGTDQVARTVTELAELDIGHLYSSPCRSAFQTAEALAGARGLRVKRLETLKNLDHGLWHGKRIDEVRLNQPKTYRQGQEHPELICPPGGEPVESARNRVRRAVAKLRRKHRSGTVALVVSEPLATLVQCELNQKDMGDLWKAECDCGSWDLIEVQSEVA